MILSRGLLTFAFFGTDTFVPYALHDGRGASLFAGSVAVTVATVVVDHRHVDARTAGSTAPVRRCFIRSPSRAVAGDRRRGPRRGPRPPPFWMIQSAGRRWARHGTRVRRPLATRAALRAGPRSTARRRHRCSCSTTSASPSVPAPPASIVTLGDDAAGTPGDAVAAACIPATPSPRSASSSARASHHRRDPDRRSAAASALHGSDPMLPSSAAAPS